MSSSAVGGDASHRDSSLMRASASGTSNRARHTPITDPVTMNCAVLYLRCILPPRSTPKRVPHCRQRHSFSADWSILRLLAAHPVPVSPVKPALSWRVPHDVTVTSRSEFRVVLCPAQRVPPAPAAHRTERTAPPSSRRWRVFGETPIPLVPQTGSAQRSP